MTPCLPQTQALQQGARSLPAPPLQTLQPSPLFPSPRLFRDPNAPPTSLGQCSPSAAPNFAAALQSPTPQSPTPSARPAHSQGQSALPPTPLPSPCPAHKQGLGDGPQDKFQVSPVPTPDAHRPLLALPMPPSQRPRSPR